MTIKNKKNLVGFNRLCIFVLILIGLSLEQELGPGEIILGIASAWWLWLPTFVKYELTIQSRMNHFCEQISFVRRKCVSVFFHSFQG